MSDQSSGPDLRLAQAHGGDRHQEEKNDQSEPLADSEPSISMPHEGRADPEHLDTRPNQPNKHSYDSDRDDDQHALPSEKTSGGIKAASLKHPFAIIICGGLIIIGAIGGFAYYLHESYYESTDDAFIDARPVLVSPQVTGNIIAVYVNDDQLVKKGDLLAKIDPRDYQAAVNQAAAQIEQAEATMTNLDARISAQQDQIAQASQQVTEAQAAFTFAQEENARYQDLARTGSGTVQRAQQAASDLKSRRAALQAALAAEGAAERQIKVLQTQKQVTAAQRDQYIAQKDRADADLSRTELRATVDGRIARLTAAVGNLATSAQSIMVLVPLDVWVTANFKETQLANMRIGQPVDISIDAYGRSYKGHVVGIQAGSGTAFSLLPAENATGNYVKVVQRVPVKITFDQRPDVELGPGMSVVPTVTVRP
jgi:membrane fusion protein, multidrug efflux system